MKHIELIMQNWWVYILVVCSVFFLNQDMVVSQEKEVRADYSAQLAKLENFFASGVPEIHSVQYCEQIKDPEKRAVCKKGTDWGIKFSRELYQYQKGLNYMTQEQIKISIQKFIKFRARLAEEPNYGNCLLASYVGVIIQEWLMQKLIVNGGNFDDIYKLYYIHNKYFPLKTLGQMLEAEYGEKAIDYKKFEESPDTQLIELFKAAEKLIENDTAGGNTSITGLLENRNAEGCLFQIIKQQSDEFIFHGLVLFKNKNGIFHEKKKEFIAELENKVPEIFQKIVPGFGEPIAPSVFWERYQRIKEQGISALVIPEV